MSDLTAFRDHARRMAGASHKPECHATSEHPRWFYPQTIRPDPDCAGCITDADRALWGRLADEVDTYLAPPQVDLFGVESIEPPGGEEVGDQDPLEPTTFVYDPRLPDELDGWAWLRALEPGTRVPVRDATGVEVGVAIMGEPVEDEHEGVFRIEIHGGEGTGGNPAS